MGVTGAVGKMKTGEGVEVILRADMDALPVAEAIGLPYDELKLPTFYWVCFVYEANNLEICATT